MYKKIVILCLLILVSAGSGILAQESYNQNNILYIKASGGIQSHYNSIQNDDIGLLKGTLTTTKTYGLQLRLEHESKTFYEVGVHHVSYEQFFKIGGSNERYQAELSYDLKAIFVNVGSGYIFLNRSGKHLINVEGGLAAGINTKPNSILNNDVPLGLSERDIEYSFNNREGYKIYPLLYVGVSKDLKLTDRIGFYINYRYYQGILPAYKTSIRYSTPPGQSTYMSTAQLHINGSSHHFLLGLRFKLGQRT